MAFKKRAARPPVPASPEALYPLLSHGAQAPREMWSRQADVLCHLGHHPRVGAPPTRQDAARRYPSRHHPGSPAALTHRRQGSADHTPPPAITSDPGKWPPFCAASLVRWVVDVGARE